MQTVLFMDSGEQRIETHIDEDSGHGSVVNNV